MFYKPMTAVLHSSGTKIVNVCDHHSHLHFVGRTIGPGGESNKTVIETWLADRLPTCDGVSELACANGTQFAHVALTPALVSSFKDFFWQLDLISIEFYSGMMWVQGFDLVNTVKFVIIESFYIMTSKHEEVDFITIVPYGYYKSSFFVQYLNFLF